ncbi:hypothetical protein C0991_006089 [Blastosporella zonata]|nr:hypothetical protein C0991_006089 [Blastosporella zonata]
MLIPDKLLNDREYYEHHIRDLTLDSDLGRPVVVQLCGNDVQTIVQAGRKLQEVCDGIDLNLGCPQDAAREGHYGAYLADHKDWPLVQDIGEKSFILGIHLTHAYVHALLVSGMSHSFTVPTSVKIRLGQPVDRTVEFAQRLEASGAAWVTLHARNVSARRRRQGAADLDQVKRLKRNLQIPVISNGNVRDWSNIPENLEYTGADGVMVGETLLGNPCLFANKLPDPVDIALEYLDICRHFPGTASVPTMQTHIRHFVEFQCGRRPWFSKFRSALGSTKSLEDMDALLRTKVERWRGRPPRRWDSDTSDEDDGVDFFSKAVDLSLMLE